MIIVGLLISNDGRKEIFSPHVYSLWKNKTLHIKTLPLIKIPHALLKIPDLLTTPGRYRVWAALGKKALFPAIDNILSDSGACELTSANIAFGHKGGIYLNGLYGTHPNNPNNPNNLQRNTNTLSETLY